MTLRDDPAEWSLPALRDLADERGKGVSRAFVRRLESDPRKGARCLASSLARRLEADDRERRRRRRMLALERAHWQAGKRLVAGVDEVGVGPLAGPVVAAAVIISPEEPPLECEDSKQLDARTRERLADEIRTSAVAVSVGMASVDEIRELNVHHAGLLAMRRAVLGLDPRPEQLLVDARTVPGVDIPQEAHVRGDARSCAIAAASIVAKVHRDALMRTLAAEHPGYGFDSHFGYSTPTHLDALRRLGPCAIHRTSWTALTEHSGAYSPLFYALRDALRAAKGRDEMTAWQRSVQASLAELAPGEVRRLDTLARRRGDARPATLGAVARSLPLE